MANSADIRIDFLGVDKTLSRSLSTATKNVEKSGHRMEKVSSTMRKAFIGAGAAMAGAFGGAVVIASIRKSITAASDLSESVSKTKVVFEGSAKSVLAWSQTSARAFGLSRQAALEAAGTYGNLFTSMGMSEKAAAGMSKSLVELAGDLASFNNVSPEDALEALRSGLTGETEPLKRFGINMNEATLKAQALKMGLIDSVKDGLTPAQKAQAAYALILQQTTKAQGDFTRTSGGLANQTRIMKAQFTDLAASLGTVLVPAVTWVLVKLNEYVGWVQANWPKARGPITDFFTWLRDNGKPIMNDVWTVIKDTFTWVRDNSEAVWGWLKTNMPKIVKTYEDMAAAIDEVKESLGFANVETKKSTSNMAQLKEVIIKLVVPFAALKEITTKAADELNKFAEVGQYARTMVVLAWTDMKTKAKLIWSAIVTIVKSAKNNIVDYVNAIIGAINYVFKAVGVDKKIDLFGGSGRRGGGGDFSSGSGKSASTSRVSTPAIMDNGGTGASGGGGRAGFGGAVGDWAKNMLGGLGVKWPSGPGGLFSGAGKFILDAVKEALVEIIRKSGGPGRKIVEIAKTMLGVPYLWGGTSPAGFDCSGLIYWAYKQAGFNIPRTGMWNAGRQVSPASARPADVLFYRAGGAKQGVRYGHVKMYAGNGMTIESTSGGVQMRPADWGGAGEVRTYLAKGGVVVGEAGAEAVLPLESPRAKRRMAAAGLGGSYIDNSRVIVNLPAGITPRQAEAMMARQIAAHDARRAAAAAAWQRGRVR